jgi:hypothetical protein
MRRVGEIKSTRSRRYTMENGLWGLTAACCATLGLRRHMKRRGLRWRARFPVPSTPHMQPRVTLSLRWVGPAAAAVLDSERKLVESRVDAAHARDGTLAAIAALKAATGGGLP